MSDQPNQPGFAALARFVAQASEALDAEMRRRIEEARPALEALSRQLAADGEATVRAAAASLSAMTRSGQQPRHAEDHRPA